MNTALSQITQGVVEIIREEALAALLDADRPLRIKGGFDPTASDLHLGHTVLLHKMRQFQDLGHEVLFLIGDFTARIGDPTGKSALRPTLDAEAVRQNAMTYRDQVFKILDSERTTVVFNSEWMEQQTAADLIRWASTYTVARMLERDDFHKRYQKEQPIAIHEFLYPLMQGYDSVHLKADVEIGGTDQKFNLLMGRVLQKQYGMPSQVVMTMPLLEGTDGVQKMSKSLGNYIGISEAPTEMFGKIMSISDALMWRYFEVLGYADGAQIADWQQAIAQGKNPRDYKEQFARDMVALYHDAAAAEAAAEDFKARFTRGAIPDDIPEKVLEATESGGLPIANLLHQAGLVSGTSDGRRMIQQGGVKMDGERLEDPRQAIPPGEAHVYQVGKRRFARVRVTKMESAETQEQ